MLFIKGKWFLTWYQKRIKPTLLKVQQNNNKLHFQNLLVALQLVEIPHANQFLVHQVEVAWNAYSSNSNFELFRNVQLSSCHLVRYVHDIPTKQNNEQNKTNEHWFREIILRVLSKRYFYFECWQVSTKETRRIELLLSCNNQLLCLGKLINLQRIASKHMCNVLGKKIINSTIY